MTDAEVARNSAWMALGTVVSRVTGFGRLYLLAFTIGTHLDADLFNNANSIPNALYILVAGGIFNVVLVPQMVRAMRRDADGGEAFTARIITLGLLVLTVSTIVLVAIAPAIVHLVFDAKLFEPQFEAQHESARLLMWLCMPQVFFYGAFVLLGQVLNARGTFGPMMWAPIANNLVAIAMLGVYLGIYGSADGHDGFTTGQAVLLGAGSTIGIAVQAALLLPYLRRAGFRYRPRFDFRGAGLGRTVRLGAWTIGFIVVNQLAFIVVQRLGTEGTLSGAEKGTAAAGTAVYEIGFLMSQLPHGVVTVSLATALIPTLSALAADSRFQELATQLGRNLRLILTIVAPLAVAAAILGPTAVRAVSFGGIRENAEVIGMTLAAFSPAMIAFPIHYLALRGFYAMENTRTPFFIQIAVAATNVTAAIVLSTVVKPAHVSVALAFAFDLAYIVGACLAVALLPGPAAWLFDSDTRRFLVRLSVACAVAAGVLALGLAAFGWLGVPIESGARALGAVALAGGAGAAAYLVSSRVLGMKELTELVRALRR
jgi:putative peptidoglycan lipid II flippase